MQVTQEQIEALLELENSDKASAMLKKAFDELPQRQKILDVRAKREELLRKAEQVAAMQADNKKKIAEAQAKDASFAKRQDSLQADINASSDFRNIEKKSKELAGLQRQREECAASLAGFEADRKKIVTLVSQIDAAMSKLQSKEESLIESFRREGGELQQRMASLQKRRQQLISVLGDDLKADYEKIVQANGGIAIGKLEEGRCSVCRWMLQDHQLINVRKQAPLGTCPNCKRLLLIE